ncbi:sensor histidine kinase [Actinomadura litoris]|uniref:histidine kinase n=1 Tax=Actinomadura litoris TaxID=2678616 RepID=A0A7K1L319_9ACTN|nr:histidine kinase [Actinomadura litoris]MUN38820.1 histidine kinase [Actinomadura litoris]
MRAVNLAVALGVAVSTASGDLGVGRSLGEHTIARLDPPLWLAVPLGLLVGAALLRSRRPEVPLALALLAWTTLAAFVAVMVAQYRLAERTRSRRRTAAATLVAVLVLGVPLWRLGGPDAAAPLTAAICLAPALLGLYVGTRRELIARVRERADRLEREQHRRVRQARADERARIARDMHDVVTHRVSLMVLNATALEAAEGRDAVAAGRRIGDIGREALGELRSLVEVLRADGEAPLAPQPGLADLAALISDTRRLGTPVRFEAVAEPGSAPSALVEHAVYRVVQEALTNAHKHARGAGVEVRVVQRPGVLRLRVANGASPQAARGGGPPGGGLPDGGFGLLGIAERIRLLGGELTTGATPQGGFEVRAEVPL